MSAGAYRYPGAHSFADTEVDRALFFGRDAERESLLHSILSESLVVLYAKSGTGKSSLLNAGLNEALRQRGFLPLTVRVNAPALDQSLDSIYDLALTAASRQGIEVKDGDRATLLRYFTTVELWSADTLLTPVVIFDQFEELFSLHAKDRRARFIEAFSELVTGRGEGASGHLTAASAPPAVRTVIAIREDFLGQLEELAPFIPQILHRRFRLEPLRLAGARDAIEKPAAVVDEALRTGPFRYAPGTVDRILAFLCAPRPGAVIDAPAVEPFQLQLICQHVEMRAEEKRTAAPPSEASLPDIDYDQDLGGDAGLRRMLKGFYERQLDTLAKRYPRRRLMALCERGLINAQGRRLSLEETEIDHRFGLDAGALTSLVDARLLRVEPRVGSKYYELSHDTLAEPVFQARQLRARQARRRVGTVAAAAAAVVVVVLGMWYLRGREEDRIMRLAAAIDSEIGVSPGRALASAIAVTSRSLHRFAEPPPQVQRALFRAVDQVRSLRVDLSAYGTHTIVLADSGRLAAAGLVDGRVIVIDTSGRTVREFRPSVAGAPGPMAMASGGDRLAAVTGTAIDLWDVVDDKLLGSVDARQRVTALAVHPSEELVVAALEDQRVVTFAVAGQALQADSARTAAATGHAIQRLLFAEDGTALSALTAAGKVLLWSATSPQPAVVPLEEAPSGVSDRAAAVAEGTFAFVDGRNRGWVIRRDTGTHWIASDPDLRDIRALAVNAAGTVVAIAAQGGSRLLVFRQDAAAGRTGRRVLSARLQGISAIAIHPAATHIVVATTSSSNAFELTELAIGGSSSSKHQIPMEAQVVAYDATGGRVLVGMKRSNVPILRPPSATGSERTGGSEVPGAGGPSARWIEEGELVRRYAPTTYVQVLVFGPGGNRLVLADDEDGLEVWEFPGVSQSTAKPPDRKPGGPTLVVPRRNRATSVTAAAWAPNGRRFVTIDEAGACAIFTTAARGVTESECPPGNGADSRLERSSLRGLLRRDSNPLAAVITGSDAKDIRLTTLRESGEVTVTESKTTQPWRPALIASSISLAPSGRLAIGVDSGGVYDLAVDSFLANGVQPWALRASSHTGAAIAATARHGDGTEVVSVDQDGTMKMWSESGASTLPAQLFVAPTDGATAVTTPVAPPPARAERTTSQLAVTGDRVVGLVSRELVVGHLVRDHPGRDLPDEEILQGLDLRRQFLVTLSNDRLVVRDLRTFDELTWARELSSHCKPASAAVSPTHGTLAVGCHNGRMVFFTPAMDQVFNAEAPPSPSMAASGNAEVASAEPDAGDGSRALRVIAYSADGELITAGAADGTLLVWDRRGKLLGSVPRTERAVSAIATRADPSFGPVVAAAETATAAVSIWRLTGPSSAAPRSLERAHDLERPGIGTISRLEFAPDGVSLFAIEDEFVRVWSWKAKDSARMLEQPAPVRALQLAADGAFAIVDAKGCYRWWRRLDAEEDVDRLILPLFPASCEGKPDQSFPVRNARFAPGGSVVLLQGDGLIPISIDWREWLGTACTRLRWLSDDSWQVPEALTACRAQPAAAATTALVQAVEHGSLLSVDRALSTVTGDRSTSAEAAEALTTAARRGYRDIVRLLVARGVPVNAADARGQTALHHAAWSGDLATVRALLVAKGATETRDRDGVTPLMQAVSRGHLSVVKALVAANADVNATAESGVTPLMIAAARNRGGIAEYLLDHGATRDAEAPASPGNNYAVSAAVLAERFAEGSVRTLFRAARRRQAIGLTPRIWLAPPFINGFDAEIGELLQWQRQEPTAQPASVERTMESWRVAARAGSADAEVLLGLARSVGFGGARSADEAAGHFRQAAAAGHAGAEGLLGFAYLAGLGVEQDYAIAVTHLESAAAKDDGFALYVLGNTLLDGLGSRRDGLTIRTNPSRARELLDRGVKSGFAPAINSRVHDVTGSFERPSQLPQFKEENRKLEDLLPLMLKLRGTDPFIANALGLLATNDRRFSEASDLFRQGDARPGAIFFPWALARGGDVLFTVPLNNLAGLADEPSPAADATQVVALFRRAVAGREGELPFAWLLENPDGPSFNRDEAIRFYRRAAVGGSLFAWTRLLALGVGP